MTLPPGPRFTARSSLNTRPFVIGLTRVCPSAAAVGCPTMAKRLSRWLAGARNEMVSSLSTFFMFLIRFALNSNKSNSHDFTPNTLQACRLPSNMTGKSMPGEEDRRMAEIYQEQKWPA